MPKWKNDDEEGEESALCRKGNQNERKGHSIGCRNLGTNFGSIFEDVSPPSLFCNIGDYLASWVWISSSAPIKSPGLLLPFPSSLFLIFSFFRLTFSPSSTPNLLHLICSIFSIFSDSVPDGWVNE